MAIAIRMGEQTRQVQMVCLDELVPDDDVLRRSDARDCLHEDEGFARAIEDFMLF